MPKDFQLQLNNPPNGTYFPGSVVSGKLLLTTDVAREYRAIQVSLTGICRVHWMETKRYGEYEQTYDFFNQEDLINRLTVVWDKNEHGGGGKLPPGSYQWPFTFVLEGTNLLPSYEDNIGTIRYKVVAKLVKDALLKFDTEVEATLNVANAVPINRPDLLQTQALSVEKTLWCLCCTSAPIRITATIPRTGYCVERDAISLEVEVENGSNSEVKKLSAVVKRVVVYTADHELNKTSRNKTVSEFPPCDPIPARSTYVWKPTPLQVPFIPTSLTNCPNISLSYVLEVSASLSGASDPKLDFPIFLGNVPIFGANNSSDSQPSAGVDLGVSPPAGTVLSTTDGALPTPGLDDTAPSRTQAIPNSEYPVPATACAPYQALNHVSEGEKIGFAAPYQLVMENKPSPKPQLPKGFIDPIRRS